MGMKKNKKNTEGEIKISYVTLT